MSTVTLEAGAVIEACERIMEGRAPMLARMSKYLESMSLLQCAYSAPFLKCMNDHILVDSTIKAIKHLAMVGRDHGCDVTLSREDCDLLGRFLLNPYEPKIEDFY